MGFFYAMFESDVIPDSGKSFFNFKIPPLMFESDVIPDSGKSNAFVNQA